MVLGLHYLGLRFPLIFPAMMIILFFNIDEEQQFG